MSETTEDQENNAPSVSSGTARQSPDAAQEQRGTVAITTSPSLDVPPPANTVSSELQAFRDIARQLSPEDLKQPGVQKLWLDKMERLIEQNGRLSGYETRFHEADKENGILTEKLKKRTAIDILWTAGVSIGLTMVSLAPTFWGKDAGLSIALGVFGLIFIGAGIATRVVIR